MVNKSLSSAKPTALLKRSDGRCAGVMGALRGASHSDCPVDGGNVVCDSKYFFFQVRYTEAYEQQRGKGSFPAMITPAYQIAKRANQLASDVSVPGYVVTGGEESGSYPDLASPASCLLLCALWIQEGTFLQSFQSVLLEQ